MRFNIYFQFLNFTAVVLCVISPQIFATSFDCQKLLSELHYYSTEPGPNLVTSHKAGIEAKSLLINANARILGRLCVSDKNVASLISALEGNSALPLLPSDLWRRLASLQPDAKSELIKLLQSANRNQKTIEAFLTKAFGEETYSPSSIRTIFASYATFHELGTDLSDVHNADGTINIDKILTTGRLSSAAEVRQGKPLVTKKKLQPNQVYQIIFVVNTDRSGVRRMRLSVLEDHTHFLNSDWGLRFHSHLALGEDAELAGKIFLNSDGKIRAIDLESGHFMNARQEEIDRFVEQRGSDDDDRTGLAQLARQKDEAALTKLVKDEFNLATSELKVLVRKADWDAYQSADGNNRAIAPAARR
jgi:hypothetical protein